ncbi:MULTISPECIES: benzoate/H(+) symporter BenE family transporter [Halomonadaceae]|jgi:benzoate membrane transport protein|uniref:Benzoate/H(+) symporter BenE family transporter n=1 Tax=Vreelandella piezotolerans TaxID=2609667 RepID=A0ABQ6X9J9_9GAMM|nr:MULTISPECIES: benzoate/H(+) symporter BenE family transporter [Halomonas]KAE8438681.1 benzoate/H(+) symporter BenE family transporter [Halomonas piezotolerans]MCG7576474.1 benzoate/H(+) symporter BenE family transporter [Halomonas sp. MMH1-48]MCG7603537.1 benzoate/H(+) symporter BenE family transporter [Halomonas sp. MM17-34]MCG7612787.1 benzoate/H(+) symporter BenE family transporter [Halomonas sp. MM17-29]MCG7620750.1 benzoate/H(+) symporter BenE family transporter [Halomonas sp. DSH1-27]
MQLHKDWSVSAITAGFVAVLVSYSGPLAIFFQAAQSADISSTMMTSWVWAISMGAAISGILLSMWLKVPVVTAWSAPGTALLVTLFPELSLNEAVGAYLTAAILLFVIGITGSFDRIIQLIPPGIASAMMAGILFQFGVGIFESLRNVPTLVIGMMIAYLVFKRLTPRYSLICLLLVGVVLAVLLEGASLEGVGVQLAQPQFIQPDWTWKATLSLAIPLVLVSLTGQFLPGMAILRTSGYTTPAKPIVTVASVTSLLTAFFGGITTVIAAITAAICTSKEAHEDPDKRYVAGVANGVFYLVGGLFAGTIVALFTSLPNAFVAVLAGLALMGAISSNISAFAAEKSHLEASVLTFVATASGVSFLGLGSAFWGVVVGGLAYNLLHRRFAPLNNDTQ